MFAPNLVGSWLDERSEPVLVTLCLGLVALLGLLDWRSGFEISFAVFYTLPVLLAAWHGRRRPALVVAAAATVTWLLANLYAGELHHPVITAWNAGTRLAFFAILSVLAADLRALLERERALSGLDSLTGIDNRRSFLAKGARTLSDASSSGVPVSTLFIDVDGFKKVNDQQGHAAGDELLCELAALLRTVVRATDTAARLGGDEFAVLLPNTDQAGAVELAERIAARTRDLVRRRGWPISLSIGVFVQTQPRLDIEATLRLADELMYEAKSGGKDQLCVRVAEHHPAEQPVAEGS